MARPVAVAGSESFGYDGGNGFNFSHCERACEMANNKFFSFGPLALTTTLTTNILNPATATGGVNGGSSAQYIIIRRMRIVNKTGTAATFSLWKGATGGNAAGTEIGGIGTSVPANQAVDLVGPWIFNTADFLVGGAGTTTALTIEGSGEVGVAG